MAPADPCSRGSVVQQGARADPVRGTIAPRENTMHLPRIVRRALLAQVMLLAACGMSPSRAYYPLARSSGGGGGAQGRSISFASDHVTVSAQESRSAPSYFRPRPPPSVPYFPLAREDRSAQTAPRSAPARGPTSAVTTPRVPTPATTTTGTTQASTDTAPGQVPVRAARVLIYTADLDVVVNDVTASIDRAIVLATSLGGYLSARDDTTVTVRVPVEHFRELMDQLEHLGDVQHRNVRAEDVSEQFHDLEVQLASLHAVRRRLEEFLARATSVADAMAVEQQLRRVGAEIDAIEGRMRFLANQASLSTITLRVIQRPSVGTLQPATYGTPELVLPFEWLQQLGLPRLLESR